MGLLEFFEEQGERAGLLERQTVVTTDADPGKRFAKDYRGLEARQEGEAEVLLTNMAERLVEEAQRAA